MKSISWAVLLHVFDHLTHVLLCERVDVFLGLPGFLRQGAAHFVDFIESAVLLV